jgi:2'-5' RNA ligase
MTPHVTLARFRSPVAPDASVPMLPALIADFGVTEPVLLESRLTPAGPKYSPLKIFSLQTSAASRRETT